MKLFLTTCSILFLFFVANAQDRSRNVWCFGGYAELDFNSGAPVSVNGCAMFTSEGCASIADKTTGALLFYTDGTSVWNATNTIMPNNTIPLGGDPSSTQSAIIVPFPGSGNKYYLFTVDDQAGYEFHGNGGVSYAVIDMSLNGGLGDVSAQPQTLVTPTCEKITVAKMADNTGYWMVTHLWGSDTFYSYPITISGIGAPVPSQAGISVMDQGLNTGVEAIGYMKISPDASKIAIAHDNTFHTVQVFNFNNATGLISDTVLSDTTLFAYNATFNSYKGPYGISFSPNSQLLYVTVEGSSNIYQYNLAAGNPAVVLASRNVIGTGSSPYALQLAPDLKIYGADGFPSLDRINDPDVYGTGCNFVAGAVPINFGEGLFGLPDFIENINISVTDTIAVSAAFTYTNCAGDTMITFADTTLNGTTTAYLWTFGDPSTGILDTSSLDTATHNFSASGTYQVTLKINTGTDSLTITKTVIVHNSPPVMLAGNDTSFCANDSAQLLATSTGLLHYIWSPSTGLSCVLCPNPVAKPVSTTSYYVQATDSFSCIAHDSVKVTIEFATSPTITADRDTICSGDSVRICAPSGYAAYQWNASTNTSACTYAKLANNYYCTVTEYTGCTAESNHLAMYVYPSQTVGISANGDTLLSFNAVTYQWFKDGIAIPEAVMSGYVVTESGLYTVLVSDEHGCYETSPPDQVMIEGVEQINKENWIKVYPNPLSSGNWQLATGPYLIGSTVEIYDDNARLIYKSEIRNQLSTIRLDIARGVYTMRVTFKNAVYNLKLMKL